jgi:hypothetical protein
MAVSKTVVVAGSSVGAAAVLAVALLVGRQQATPPAAVTATRSAATPQAQATLTGLVTPPGAAGGSKAGNPDDLNTGSPAQQAAAIIAATETYPPAPFDATADDMATANRYSKELGYEYLVGRGDIIRRWRNEASGEDPVVWLAKNGFESWQADCDITTTVPFRPLDVEFQADTGITGVEVSWNPHAHGVDWNTSSETIRQQVPVPRSQQVLGDVPITLHGFPCVHPPFLFAWYSTSAPKTVLVCPPECPGRCDATGKCVAFNSGVLHATAAAFIGPARPSCGLTYIDDTGRAHPLAQCSTAEIIAAGKAGAAQ